MREHAMQPSHLDLVTRCAHWGWLDHRYFGHAVFEELAGRTSVTGLLALSVLGRRLPDECLDMLDDIACVCTLADPRIWPLKMSRIVAAYGATMPAVAAGCLILQSARIGPWKTEDAAAVLSEFHGQIGEQLQDETVVDRVLEIFFSHTRVISGFGAPFHDHDERLLALRHRVRERGRDRLPHWLCMEVLANRVRATRRLHPNLGLGLAAALLDMGIAVGEVGSLCTILCQHMFFANAVEGARQAPPVLQKIPTSRVVYAGRSARTSPKAAVTHPSRRFGV